MKLFNQLKDATESETLEARGRFYFGIHQQKPHQLQISLSVLCTGPHFKDAPAGLPK